MTAHLTRFFRFLLVDAAISFCGLKYDEKSGIAVEAEHQ